MRKTIVFSITIVSLLHFLATTSFAVQTAGSSAAVVLSSAQSQGQNTIQAVAIRKKAIAEVLKRHNSPLIEEVDSFIEACSSFDLDCYLLPSIAGVESGFGRHLISYTHNPFGWGRGLIEFSSFHEAILTIGEKLRTQYINKGAASVEAIGSIYCEGNTWAGKVLSFMREFEKEEQKQLYFIQDTVQL